MYLTHVYTTITAALTNDSIARQEAIECLNTDGYCTLTDTGWILLCRFACHYQTNSYIYSCM